MFDIRCDFTFSTACFIFQLLLFKSTKVHSCIVDLKSSNLVIVHKMENVKFVNVHQAKQFYHFGSFVFCNIIVFLLKLCALLGLNFSKSDEIFLKSFGTVYN
jgi:hypothetical protein